jgi:hypothetical protein
MPTPPEIEYDPLRAAHQTAGQAVFTACSAEVFPFDAFAFAVLERSLSLVKGFELLSGNGGYMSAMALLRMQLDNVLRFNGVAQSGDPHGVANQVFIHGKHIRTIKDRSGQKMTDAYLLGLMEKGNPWIREIYDHASGYVHLSKHHFLHVVARFESGGDGLQRKFAIGDDDAYVSAEQKQKLNNAFVRVTQGVAMLVSAWPKVRDSHGANRQLKQRFNKAV